jgi:hypothetical protein
MNIKASATLWLACVPLTLFAADRPGVVDKTELGASPKSFITADSRSFTDHTPHFHRGPRLEEVRSRQRGRAKSLDSARVNVSDRPEYSATSVIGMLPEFTNIVVQDARDIADKFGALYEYMGFVDREAFVFESVRHMGSRLEYRFVQTVASIPFWNWRAVFWVDPTTGEILFIRASGVLDIELPTKPVISADDAISLALKEDDVRRTAPTGHMTDGLEYRIVEGRVLMGWRVLLQLEEPVRVAPNRPGVIHQFFWVGAPDAVRSSTQIAPGSATVD